MIIKNIFQQRLATLCRCQAFATNYKEQSKYDSQGATNNLYSKNQNLAQKLMPYFNLTELSEDLTLSKNSQNDRLWLSSILVSSISSAYVSCFSTTKKSKNIESGQLSSEQLAVLKTYLQVIPPHKISQMIQQKEHKLDNLLRKANSFQRTNTSLCKYSKDDSNIFELQKENITKLNLAPQSANANSGKFEIKNSGSVNKFPPAFGSAEQQLQTYRQIFKFVKSRLPYIQIQNLCKIVELTQSWLSNASKVTTSSEQQDKLKTSTQIRQYCHKTYLKIVRHVEESSQALPFQSLVSFIYTLAKLNKREPALMKAAEQAFLEVKLKINYPIIKKILFAFTHLDCGTSVLYSHISKTIKIGQYELQPLELAECAYMLSKVSQNAKGGYGTFEIASKHIEANFSRMSFSNLVKVSGFMLAQNIGTNKFQFMLQAELYKKYPSKDKLQIADLTMLLKATSAYYFKFNNKALFNMLKTSTMREAYNSTLQQFQDILWSWGRLSQKGDQALWKDCLQPEVVRRINYLRPRQISFFYHSICSSLAYADPSVLALLEQKLTSNPSTPLSMVSSHYLVKMLLSMQKLKHFNKQLFIQISVTLCNNISKLSKNQLISFAKTLNESQYDYTNKNEISEIITALQEVLTSKLAPVMYVLNLQEIAELLYLVIKFDIGSGNNQKERQNQGKAIQSKIDQFRTLCFNHLSQVINIPKQSFIKTLFCFTIKDNYSKAMRMIVILEQLCTYGPIGYFFSPHQFPLLAYCVLHMHYNGNGQLGIALPLINEITHTLKEIDPNILNGFVNKAYEQGLNILQRHDQNVKKSKAQKASQKS